MNESLKERFANLGTLFPTSPDKVDLTIAIGSQKAPRPITLQINSKNNELSFDVDNESSENS